MWKEGLKAQTRKGLTELSGVRRDGLQRSHLQNLDDSKRVKMAH
jgi:hypothetical protein